MIGMEVQLRDRKINLEYAQKLGRGDVTVYVLRDETKEQVTLAFITIGIPQNLHLYAVSKIDVFFGDKKAVAQNHEYYENDDVNGIVRATYVTYG